MKKQISSGVLVAALAASLFATAPTAALAATAEETNPPVVEIESFDDSAVLSDAGASVEVEVEAADDVVADEIVVEEVAAEEVAADQVESEDIAFEDERLAAGQPKAAAASPEARAITPKCVLRLSPPKTAKMSGPGSKITIGTSGAKCVSSFRVVIYKTDPKSPLIEWPVSKKVGRQLQKWQCSSPCSRRVALQHRWQLQGEDRPNFA